MTDSLIARLAAGTDLTADKTTIARYAAALTAICPPVAALFTPAPAPLIAVAAIVFAGIALMSVRAAESSRPVLIALSLIGQCITFTAAFSGHPWQIDAHMSFFAALAIIATMGDVWALVFAVLLTAVHHIAFGFLIPSLIYPSSEFLENAVRTAVHAFIVLFEAGVLLLSIRAATLARQEIEAGQEQLQLAMQGAVAAQNAAEAARRDAETSAEATRETGHKAAEAVKQITEAAVQASQTAAESRQVVARARDDAEASDQVVQQTRKAMVAVKDSSDKIAAIAEMIDEIARRTDLLALNAAIESARAGEAGRGFAVVAKEVRKLAQQSADATMQIRNLVSASAVHVSESSVLVERMGQGLDHILSAVSDLDGRMQAIAEGAALQSADLQHLNAAISRIDHISTEPAGRKARTRLGRAA